MALLCCGFEPPGGDRGAACQWRLSCLTRGLLVIVRTMHGNGHKELAVTSAAGLSRSTFGRPRCRSGGSPVTNFKRAAACRHAVTATWKRGVANPIYLNSIELAVNDAGLRALRLHSPRRTFARRVVQAGLSLVEIHNLLGHSSPITSLRYARIKQPCSRKYLYWLSHGKTAGYLGDSNQLV